MTDSALLNSQPATCNPQLLWRTGLLVWSVTMFGALSVLALIFAAPLAAASGHEFAAFVIYRGFKPLCHQLAARSFHLHEHPLAVCARCLGLYVGFASGAIVYPFVRSLNETQTPARVWLILAALPTALDFALGFTGVRANTHLSRFLTATLLGSIIIFYVLPGLVDAVRILRQSMLDKRSFQNNVLNVNGESYL